MSHTQQERYELALKAARIAPKNKLLQTAAQLLLSALGFAPQVAA